LKALADSKSVAICVLNNRTNYSRHHHDDDDYDDDEDDDDDNNNNNNNFFLLKTFYVVFILSNMRVKTDIWNFRHSASG